MLASTGTIIDEQFEILSPIGSGGYGVVYRAKQLQLDRIVALKMLNTSFDGDSDIQQRFEREAQALSALKHRNLVMVYGTGVWEGRPYMNMEFVKGTSLQLVLEEEGRLDTKRTIKIVRQILDGLACAHANGIIHRDLKPANVMLLQRGPDELVKIIDFGLAKILPGSGIAAQQVTEFGYAVGSVMYMSPEQCLALPVDSRADLYSVGCILHRCLTGTYLYEGSHSATVMAQHIQAEPKMLAQCLPEGEFSKELQWVLNKALAKDAKERYQTAEAMSSDLLLIATDRSGEISCENAEPPHSMAQEVDAEERPNQIAIHPLWAAVLGSLVTLLAVMAVMHYHYQSGINANANASSTELCRKADSLLAVDQNKAVEMYERALLKAHDDKGLPPQLAVRAAMTVASRELYVHPERAAAFAKLGIQVVRDMQSRVDDSLMGIANLYMRACINLYRPSDAVPTCRRLLNEYEKDSGAFSNKLRRSVAQGHIMMGRPGEASDALKTCTDTKKIAGLEIGLFHYCLGGIAFLQDDYRKAEAEYRQTEAEYQQAWRLDESMTSVPCLLALTEIAQNDWESAKKNQQFYEANYAPTYYSQAMTILMNAHSGNWKVANKQLDQLCRAVDKNPDLYKTIHMDFVMAQYAAAAKAAGVEPQVNFVADKWYGHLNQSYVNHMHMFKQANPW